MAEPPNPQIAQFFDPEPVREQRELERQEFWDDFQWQENQRDRTGEPVDD